MPNTILLGFMLFGFINGIVLAPSIVFMGRKNLYLKWNAIAVLLLSLTILREFIHVYGNEMGLSFSILPFLYFKLWVVGIVLLTKSLKKIPLTKPNYNLLIPGSLECAMLSLIVMDWLVLPQSFEDALFIAVDCIGFFWLFHFYRIRKEKKDRNYFLLLFLIAFALIFLTRVVQLIAILTQWEEMYRFHFNFRITSLGFILYGLSLYLMAFYLRSNQKKRRVNQRPSVLSKDESILHQIEDDCLYLDHTINLEKLAVTYGLDSKSLSATIKKYRNTSFNDYLNTLRLQYFMECLARNEQERYTLMALAEKSGFGSKVTFNRVFKQKYEMAPSAYIEKFF